MDIFTFFNALFRSPDHLPESVILYSVRLPRVLAGLLAGIGLSVSGVLLQAVTDNSLAGPNIIGVNAGAGFSAVILLAFLPSAFFAVPFAAFFGAFAASLLIVFISSRTGNSNASVILAGVAITTLLNACISCLTLMDTDILSSYNAFSVGGFAGVKTVNLIIPAIIIFISLLISVITAPQIDLLCLGDNTAALLGVKIKPVRICCILSASASAAAAVSFAGLLGFVGLIVPHIARKLLGQRTGTRPLLLVSALCGSIITISADLFGRLIAAPSEIPVGIMMAFIGSPFFIILLLRHRER